MRRGLFSKMLATYTLIIAISFIILATFLSFWFESYAFEQRKTQLQTETKIIKPTVINYLNGDRDINDLRASLVYIGKYFTTDMWLVDNYGRVYAVSDEKEDMLGKQVISDELNKLKEGTPVEKAGAFNGEFKMPVHTYMIPIIDNGIFKGAFIMNTSIDDIKEPLKKVYEIIWLSAIFAIIASCVVIYYFSQRIMIKPLEKINEVAKKITNGEVGKRVVLHSADEIGELANSFNNMADSLELVEKNRREFISNVSHELRSPITSIKGFISGILDGVIPKEKENYYLSIAYEEIQRLTRLINDLLDLAAIQEGQVSLLVKKVDINEVIISTVIKFETKVKEKKVNVDVCLEGDDLNIMGDRDRLIQVITNLFDNAIKYAPEGGLIKVSTKKKGSKVWVSVYNSGPHIPDEDMRQLWDRFYRADKARSSKISTGLGLSIVRSILTQLGEDIWAENKEKQGVEFTFTLKKV